MPSDLWPSSGNSKKRTSQLFLFGPETDGVDQGPQPGVEPRAELQEAGVPQCQSGVERQDSGMGGMQTSTHPSIVRPPYNSHPLIYTHLHASACSVVPLLRLSKIPVP